MSRRVTRANAAESSSISNLGGSNQHISNAGMYLSGQYNHPAFNKVCLGSTSTKGFQGSNTIPKPPKAPEKPLMPYMRYSRKVWDEVKANQPELKLWEIGKIIGKMWRELPTPDKQLIIDEYETEKIDYQEMLRAYHNSPVYQNYLQAKGRAEMNESIENQIEREDAYLSIEPGAEDNGDDGLSVKHISAARFQRNQRLMQEILSDCNVVQSGRSVVTSKRLNTLCQQVESLEHHHGKLQNELLDLEDKHLATKRKWQEQAVSFENEINHLKNITPEEYYKESKIKCQQAKEETKNVSEVDNAVKQSIRDNKTTITTKSNDIVDSNEPEMIKKKFSNHNGNSFDTKTVADGSNTEIKDQMEVNTDKSL